MLGNAERLEDAHSDRIAYHPGLASWFVWDGTYWRPDLDGEVYRLAAGVVRGIREEAAGCPDSDAAQKIFRHAIKSEGQLDQMVREAGRQCPELIVGASRWNAAPNLLATPSGTVDLRTGELREARPGDYINRQTEAPFEPGARHPLWARVLCDALPNPETRAFFQRLMGYALWGEKYEQVMAFAFGQAATGKTTVIEGVRKALGTYAASIDPHALEDRGVRGGPTPELAALIDARLVVSTESSDGRRLDAGLLKRATGGEELMARPLYGSPVSFKPRFLLALVSNFRPYVDADDAALFRRLRTVPFRHQVPAERRDPGVLRGVLGEAQPAVLAWLVEGCRQWLEHGLGEPEEVRRANEAYKVDMDPLSDFWAECVEEGPGKKEYAGAIFAAYREWAERAGVSKPLSQRGLGFRLVARGLEKDRDVGGYYYSGLALRGRS